VTGGRQPATWTFDGSNNGTTWTTLHSVTGASLALSSWYNYTFTNTTAYTYYRMNVTAVFTLNSNFQLAELQMTESSSAASGGAVGGSFVLSDGVTFTATNGIVAGSTTPVLSYSGTTSATLYTTLTITNLASSVHIDHTGTGTLTMYGNITGSGFSTTVTGVRVTSSGTFTLNGSFTGLGSASSTALSVTGLSVSGNNSTININGNIGGATITGNQNNSFHIINISGASVTVNVTGAINGGSHSATTNSGVMNCIYVSGSATVTVVGNITGGSVTTNTSSQCNGIYLIAGSVTVNGDVTGGTGPTETTSCGIRASGTVNITGTVSSGSCRAVFNEGNVNVTVTGNLTANNAIAVSSAGTTSTTNIAGNVTAVNAVGVYASSTATNIITGNLTNGTSGFMAFWGQKLYLGTSGSRTWTFYNTSAAAKILYTGDQVSPAGSQPAVTDVRSGTSYALGTLTGTCAIPPRNSVTAGVPVDNGIGTALLTLSTMSSYAAAVWNTQTSALTTSGSIGERLKEASTVAITGQQIAGFDI